MKSYPMYTPAVTKVSLRKNLSGTPEEAELIIATQSAKEHVSDCVRATKAPKSTRTDWTMLTEARKKFWAAELALYGFRKDRGL